MRITTLNERIMNIYSKLFIQNSGKYSEPLFQLVTEFIIYLSTYNFTSVMYSNDNQFRNILEARFCKEG